MDHYTIFVRHDIAKIIARMIARGPLHDPCLRVGEESAGNVKKMNENMRKVLRTPHGEN